MSNVTANVSNASDKVSVEFIELINVDPEFSLLGSNGTNCTNGSNATNCTNGTGTTSFNSTDGDTQATGEAPAQFACNPFN